MENDRHDVPADAELTTRADGALTSVCRLPVAINSDWHNPPKLIKRDSAATLRRN